MANSVLYFTADLRSVLLPDIASSMPHALWLVFGDGKLDPVYLLTAKTWARVYWKADQLAVLSAAGKYPTDKMTTIMERLASMRRWANDNLDAGEVCAELNKLDATGGPKEKMPEPAPGPRGWDGRTPWENEV